MMETQESFLYTDPVEGLTLLTPAEQYIGELIASRKKAGAEAERYIRGLIVNQNRSILANAKTQQEMLEAEETTPAEAEKFMHELVESQKVILAEEQESVRKVIETQDMSRAEAIEFIRNKDVPKGLSSELVLRSERPTDEVFLAAWVSDTTNSEKKYRVDVTAAKPIAHDIRRMFRSREFGEVDMDNPNLMLNAEGEAQRQTLRDKYALMQTAIGTAKTEAGLKKVLGL